MGDKPADDEKNEPSLELPTLSLPRLRRKRRTTPPVNHAGAPADATASGPAPRSAPATPPAASPVTPPEAPAEASAEMPSDTTETSDTTVGPAADAPAQIDGTHRGRTDGLRLPTVPGRVAAVGTGLAVGLFGSGLTSLALAGCEAVTGTSSCRRPGFFLLVAILALMVLLGAVLLKAWRVDDPGSTSFLAVGVVTVTVLLLLVDMIFSPWMFLVVPLAGGASYALSHWVTTRFTDG
jgi:hypothetical protein